MKKLIRSAVYASLIIGLVGCSNTKKEEDTTVTTEKTAEKETADKKETKSEQQKTSVNLSKYPVGTYNLVSAKYQVREDATVNSKAVKEVEVQQTEFIPGEAFEVEDVVLGKDDADSVWGKISTPDAGYICIKDKNRTYFLLNSEYETSSYKKIEDQKKNGTDATPSGSTGSGSSSSNGGQSSGSSSSDKQSGNSSSNTQQGGTTQSSGNGQQQSAPAQNSGNGYVAPSVRFNGVYISDYSYQYWYVASNGLNARSDPYRYSTLYGTFRNGDCIYVSDVIINYDEGGSIWGLTSSGWVLMVETNGTWYVSNYVAPTPAPTPVIGSSYDRYYVAVDGLRIRQSPDRNYGQILDTMAYGTYFDVYEYVRDSYGAIWGRAAQGWVCVEENNGTWYVGGVSSAPASTPSTPATPDYSGYNVIYYSIVDGLRIRTAPDRNTGVIVDTMAYGTYFDVHETCYDSYGALWGRSVYGWICLVDYNGQTFAL